MRVGHEIMTVVYRRCTGSRVLPSERRVTLRRRGALGRQGDGRHRPDDGHRPRARPRPRTGPLRGLWRADGPLLPGLRPQLLSIGRRPTSHTVSLRYVRLWQRPGNIRSLDRSRHSECAERLRSNCAEWKSHVMPVEM